MVDRLFAFFASIRLAVVVLLGLVVALATATFLESIYDTPTAQYYVYRSIWFQGLLGLLGLNIFFVAVSRYPWKPKHAPFLLAHLGILTLLTGSFITSHYGLDGSLRVSEGETGSVVETDQMALVLSEKDTAFSFPVRWIPPDVTFKPMTLQAPGVPYGLKIDQFISRADSTYDFIAASGSGKPALKIRLTGGPMRITQDFWLWSGDQTFRSVQAGPAHLVLTTPALLKTANAAQAAGRPLLLVAPGENRSGLFYKAFASDGKITQGFVPESKIQGTELQPGWKMVKLTLEQWLPDAAPRTHYSPSKMAYGPQAPPSAVHVVAGKGGEGSEVWLGLGDRAALSFGGRSIDLSFLPQRLVLPFSVHLDHFNIERYEGTSSPASYESKVSVVGGESPVQTTISMNEPLLYQGITLYQASYEDAKPRPVTSIFSVNRDPGRWAKYLGSLLIVFGAISLFAVKYSGWKRLKQRFFKREMS